MVERRKDPNRRRPGEHTDVTRLEHENLCGQVDELFRAIRRTEAQFHRLEDRLDALARRLPPDIREGR